MIVFATIIACALNGSESLIVFEGPRDWTFQGKVIVPETQSGPAVLMIGGGIANDLNWSTPGSLLIGEEPRQVTITGHSHDDATALVNALVSKGCAVMHYSTVSKDDPKQALYPYELSLTDPLEIMEIAESAFATFANLPSVEGRSIVLLGFSMGAQRAVNLAKEHEKVTSIVLLSGAQITATSKDDQGGNVHYQASKKMENPELDVYDYDGDGVIHLWEISGVLAIQARQEVGIENLPTKDSSGMPFGEPVLDLLQKPTLAIYGALDEHQSCHAVILSDNVISRPWLEVRVIPGVGHQLGPEQDGKMGPIHSSICKLVAQWVIDN